MRFKKAMRILVQLAAVLLVCTAPSAQPAQPAQLVDGMALWAGPWGPHH